MLRTVVFLVILTTTVGYAGDVADRYEAYMDRLIPATFEIAREEVSLREKGVFRTALSEAQSSMDEAIVRLSNLTILGGKSEDPESGLCDVDPSEQKTVALLRRLVETSQLLNEAERAQSALQRVSETLASFEKACEKDRNIDSYQINTLYLSYLEPQLKAIDNTYVEFSGVPILDGIRLLGAFIKVVGNIAEQNKINDQMTRFRKEKAGADDYHKYAVDACEKQVMLFGPYVEDLRALGKESAAILAKISPKSIERRVLGLEDCLAQDRSESVHAYRKQLEQQVLASLSKLSEQETKTAKSIRLNGKIHANLAELSSSDCKSYEVPLRKLRAAISASRLLKLPNVRRLVPSAEEKANEWIKKCGGGLR